MKKEEDVIQSLIVGGYIGASLAALLGPKKSNTALSALAGAAILASYEAYRNALETNLPVLVEENHELYEVHSDGTKKFIKKLPVPPSLPDTFTLE